MIDREFLAETNRMFRMLLEGTGRQCPSCEDVFPIDPKHPSKRYCGPRCQPARMKKREEKLKALPKKVKCAFCPKTFDLLPSHRNKKFCSTQCKRYYAQTLKKQSEKPKVINCKRCGDETPKVGNSQLYCPGCKKILSRERNLAHLRKRRQARVNHPDPKGSGLNIQF